MKTFLAIISKQNEIAPYTLDKINIVASRSLACVPGDYTMESWKSPSNRVILCTFYNEPLLDVNCSLWSTETSAFTIAGYINSNLDKLSDTMLNKCPDESARQRAISNTNGLYSACFADGDEDNITVWNTITRIEPVYWTENDKYIIVSNKALLAHLLSEGSRTPKYDIINLGYFTNNGYYNGECTPYKGIKVLTPNSMLKISPMGAKVQVLSSLDEEELLIEPDNVFYDELTAAFIETFLPLRKHKAEIYVDLTGGRDSRLIAAALKYINIDFKAFTNGFPEHPDVVIADRVAHALNATHSVNVPQTQKDGLEEYLTVDILKRTRDTLFITDGMLSLYEHMKRCSQFLSNIINVKGNGGEVLRGGFASSTKNYDIKNIKELCFRKFFYYAAFLCDEAKRTCMDSLNNWIDAQPRWFSSADFGAQYFLDYDNGRWSATERAGTASWNYLYQPFFDNKLIEMVQRVRCNYLIDEKLVYNLLKRLAPELVDVPFDNSRWRFEANGPRAGEEALWEKRAPLKGVLNTRSAFNWRCTCLSDMKDVFYEQIFNSKVAEDIFEVVKRESVLRLFDSSRKPCGISGIDGFLWNLYSTSVLLSNEWLNDFGNSKIVKIKVPN